MFTSLEQTVGMSNRNLNKADTVMKLTKLKKWLGNLPIFSVSHSGVPKCECGEDCFVERPASINFGKFGFEIHILNFNKDIYSKYCIDCFMDIEKEPMRKAWAEAASYGYNKCLDDHGF